MAQNETAARGGEPAAAVDNHAPQSVPDAARIREALRCGASGCECARPTGALHCPGHSPDAHPSLSVSDKDGRVLAHDLSGRCDQATLIAALRERGLWPDRATSAPPRERRWPAYHAETGAYVADHVRQDRPGEDKRVWWAPSLNGTHLVDLAPYRAGTLAEHPDRPAVICEGEAATDALATVEDDLGIVAVGTVTGAATAPGDAALRPLAQRPILLWADHDDPGHRHMNRIAARLHALGCRDLRAIDDPDAVDKDDAVDAIARGADVAAIIAHARKFQGPGTPYLVPIKTVRGTGSPDESVSGSGFRFLSVDDWIENPPPPPEWQLDGVIPAAGLSMLVAKPKVGKTTFALDLAVSTAQGREVLGRPTRQGPVLYLLLEGSMSETLSRIQALGFRKGDPLFVQAGPPPAEPIEALRQAVSEHSAVLVIIDTIARFLGGDLDSNDYSQVSAALYPLECMARDLDVCITFNHHANKTAAEDGSETMGSTAFFGAVDTAIFLRVNQAGQREISTRQRYGEEMVPQILTLDPSGKTSSGGSVEEYNLRVTGERIIEAIANHGTGRVGSAELEELVGGHRADYLAARKRLRDRGEIREETEGRRKFWRLADDPDREAVL